MNVGDALLVGPVRLLELTQALAALGQRHHLLGMRGVRLLAHLLLELAQAILGRGRGRRRLRQSLRRGSRRRSRMEIELARQRRVVPGHLLAGGGCKHVAAHLDHHGRQRAAGLAHGLGQRRREGRVARRAVHRHVAGLGRVGDERPDARLQLRKPLAECRRARAHAARERARQRVVAAGIEEDDVGLRLAPELHLLQDEVDRHGLEVEIALARELRVDRDQEVAPAHLQPVPGVEQHRHVGLAERAGEVAHLEVEAALVEVEPDDDLEPRLLQRGGDVLGVVDGIGERRRMHVGGVADDEREALLGLSRPGERGRCPGQRQGEEGQSTRHDVPPMQ